MSDYTISPSFHYWIVYTIKKRESESITEIEFDRRHDSRLANSSTAKEMEKKWKKKRRRRQGKRKGGGSYCASREMFLSRFPARSSPLIFIFQGKFIVRLLTAAVAR